MRDTSVSRGAKVLLAALLLMAGCSEEPVASPEVSRPPAAMPDHASGTVPHGDHDARYGGMVFMKEDLHFEVVFDPQGAHRVYFSDALRRELPAAVVSDVEIRIVRSQGDPEPLVLEVDEFGESWVAEGRPVEDPQAVGHVSFTAETGPYQIELPFRVQEESPPP